MDLPGNMQLEDCSVDSIFQKGKDNFWQNVQVSRLKKIKNPFMICHRATQNKFEILSFCLCWFIINLDSYQVPTITGTGNISMFYN